MAVPSPQFDLPIGLRGGSDMWDEPQADAVLRRDWFSPDGGPGLSRWNSSAWDVEPLKHWNGVAFDHYGVLKHWDGAQWVASPRIPTPPPPRVVPTPPSVTVPLSGYTTGLWGAYSIRRRMVPGYAGPLFRVVRSTDSAVLDIGLVGDVTDTDALYAFLGPVGKGALSILYDQSGNGRNFTATTVALRPALDFGVSLGGTALYDGVTDGMSIAGFGGTSGATFFMSGALLSTADQALFESSANYNSFNNTLFIYYAASEGGMNVAAHGTGSSYARSSYGDVRLNDNTHAYRIDLSAPSAVDQVGLFVAGVKQTRTGNADVGTVSGTIATNPLYMGSQNLGSSLPALLKQLELAVYDVAVSDSNIAAITAAFEA